MDSQSGQKASRISQILRVGLFVFAALSAVSIAALLTGIGFMWLPADWLAYAFATCLLGALLFGAGLVLHEVLLRLQSGLGEWLVTLLGAAGGMVLMKGMLWNTISFEDRRISVAISVFLMLVVTLAFIIGSAWGWRTAQNLTKERALERLQLMAIGWLLVIGYGGAVVSVLGLLFVYTVSSPGSVAAANKIDPDMVLWSLLFSLGMSLSLACPGFMIERDIRRAAKDEKTTKATAPNIDLISE